MSPSSIMRGFFQAAGVPWTYVDELFWSLFETTRQKDEWSPLERSFIDWYFDYDIEGRDTQAFLREYRILFPRGIA